MIMITWNAKSEIEYGLDPNDPSDASSDQTMMD